MHAQTLPRPFDPAGPRQTRPKGAAPVGSDALPVLPLIDQTTGRVLAADPADPADPATWQKGSEMFGPQIARNLQIQTARDAKRCTCGHLCISHGHGADDGPTWRDGSRIGRGACGIDRDDRNHATGWTGDPCPCQTFTEAGA